MQVIRIAEPGDEHVVDAAVGAVSIMQRLVHVANDMDDEVQGQRFVLTACRRIAQGDRKPLQRGACVPLGRRADLGSGPSGRHGHVVPRTGFFLLERVRVRTFLVGVGLHLGEVLAVQDQLDLGACPAADPSVGKLTDHPVAGLIPRLRGARNADGERGARYEKYLDGRGR